MIRRYTTHIAKNVEREPLLVITIYEQGMKKEQVKKVNKYTKKHGKVVL